MGAGEWVTALVDSVFLNPAGKAVKVVAGERVEVYDHNYARRLEETGLASLGPSPDVTPEEWPQPKADEVSEVVVVEAVETEPDVVSEVTPVTPRKGRKAA